MLVGLVALLAFCCWRSLGAAIGDTAAAQGRCVATLECGAGTSLVSVEDRSTQGTSDARGRIARWAGYAWSFAKGFVWDGLVKSLILDTAVFLGQEAYTLATDPYEFYVGQYIDMGRGAYQAIKHRDGALASIESQLKEAWHEDPARFSGRAVFEAVTFVVPWLKLGKAKTITNVVLTARTVHRTQEVLAAD